MAAFTDTRLWRESLDRQATDPTTDCPRATLRDSLFSARKRAQVLGAEIARSLPEFTVHDITHIDALWQMADILAGDMPALTPTEAFVLGGAFLIHDLGNGLAAYVDGPHALRSNQLWPDTVASLLRHRLGRSPTPEEMLHPGDDIEAEATEELLRRLHAQHAERLAHINWSDAETGNRYWLIDRPEMRDDFGSLIGEIAHSHWWPVERLGPAFHEPRGAPGWCPSEWTIDPLKLACILRLADITHMDERRAPGFLRVIRKPSGESKKHWVFQSKLNQPRLDGDRLKFTSKSAFTTQESEAWWLCHDALHAVDQELHQVDGLLQESKGRARLAARSVAGTESTEHLSRLIQVRGWTPVSVRVHVSNVARLVGTIGGRQMYGDDRTVPLRELIQNARDAVDALQHLASKHPPVASAAGRVVVRLGAEDGEHFVEVEDNGVGMSAAVIQGPLLDFGNSFWNTALMREELPGLAATPFESVGRYGIGFFSTFMWGDRVRVTTRRYDAAQRETRVLELHAGATSRPVLREADVHECLPAGGTCVRVWLKDAPDSQVGFLRRTNGVWHLKDLCAWLCPAIDTDLYVEVGGAGAERAVGASDWISIPEPELLRRIGEPEHARTNWPERSVIAMAARRLTALRDPSGEIVGRAAASPRGWPRRSAANRGAADSPAPTVHPENLPPHPPPAHVTVGGFRTSRTLATITGILSGLPERASRDDATAVADRAALIRWATEQADQWLREELSPAVLLEIAGIVRQNGGSTGSLPIAYCASGWLTASDLEHWAAALDEVEMVLTRYSGIGGRTEDLGQVLAPRMVIVEGSVGTGIRSLDSGDSTRLTKQGIWWNQYPYNLAGAVIEALARAWDTTSEKILEVSIPPPGSEFRRCVVLPGQNNGMDDYAILRPGQGTPWWNVSKVPIRANVDRSAGL